MKTKVGLWIDHKKAVIVSVENEKVKKKLIESDADKQHGRINGVRSTAPFESRRVPVDNRNARDFIKHLSMYYDNVISNIRNAESVYIFGPGMAKLELLKRIKRNKIYGEIENIETTDKMSLNQIESKVKNYYFVTD